MSQEMLARYQEVRRKTLDIVKPLEVEDFCLQPSAEISPPKWHLAHTTWFFERLVLQETQSDYKAYNELYYKIFNSYYKSLETHTLRDERGLMSRPTVKEIFRYREEIDLRMQEVLSSDKLVKNLKDLIVLGLNHEQQHQELLYMDIKNILFHQPVPISFPTERNPQASSKVSEISFDGGLVEMGAAEDASFCFDNEKPRHKVWLNPFRLSTRLVTNSEYEEFIQAGGYQNPGCWFSDGWDWVNRNQITAPLYWSKSMKKDDQPVMHLSYYEASAYARFRGKRLPTEAEWEFAAATEKNQIADLHLQLWQWTQSSYSLYPGYQFIQGPLGEYNSKFAANQLVLRGGCFVTEKDHYRPTYRNFYRAEDRWAFTGLRLAADV